MVKTFWKIIVTFGVLALFVLAVAFVIFVTTQWSSGSIPVIGQGSVAVIPLKGTITMGGCPGGLFYAESCAQVDTIKQNLKDAAEDSSIKAVVLDVDSGGGNVVASRELMRAVREFSRKKPVVAWIGEVGASGAYYVVSAANQTVADEDSITGSIGVIMFVEQYYNLFDKIGINVTVIKSGKSKDTGSPYRPMDEDERAKLQDMIDSVYYDFVSDVAENRHLDVEYVKNISDGSIYLGRKAVELKLIDKNGGLDDAIRLAGVMGGIEGEPQVKEVKKHLTLKDLLMQDKSMDLTDLLALTGIFKR